MGSLERGHHVRRGGEVGAVAGVGGGNAQGDRQVALSGYLALIAVVGEGGARGGNPLWKLWVVGISAVLAIVSVRGRPLRPDGL